MKKTTLKQAILMCVIFSNSYSVPTIDAPQLYEDVQIIDRWGKQIAKWKEEITEWKDQYAAITGFRLDGSVMSKFTQINTLLQSQGLDMGDLDLENPKSQIGVLVKNMLGKFTAFKDDCHYDFMNETQKKLCTDHIVRNLKEVIAVKEIATSVEGTLKKMSSLNKQLETSKDTKTTADITSALNSASATLQCSRHD